MRSHRERQAGTSTVCVEIVLEPGEAEAIDGRQHDAEHARPQGGQPPRPRRRHDHLHVRRLQHGQHAAGERVGGRPELRRRPVRDAANDSNTDADALLENPARERERVRGVALHVHEASCRAHADGEENPVINVATAHAFDLAGQRGHRPGRPQDDDHPPGHRGRTRSSAAGRRRAGPTARPGTTRSRSTWATRSSTGSTVTNAGDTPLTVEFERSEVRRRPVIAGRRHRRRREARRRRDVDLPLLARGHGGGRRPRAQHREVTGEDALGGPKGTVTDTDSEEADVLHPDIDVDKRVRAARHGRVRRQWPEGACRRHARVPVRRHGRRQRHADRGRRVERSALRRRHGRRAR